MNLSPVFYSTDILPILPSNTAWTREDEQDRLLLEKLTVCSSRRMSYLTPPHLPKLTDKIKYEN